MRFQRLSVVVVCAAVLFSAAACSSRKNGSAVSGTVSSSPESSSSTALSLSPVSSSAETSSAKNPESSEAKTPSASVRSQAESAKPQADSEWVAYDTSKDNYKLHIKRKDGTGDKVIVNDIVLAPCVAGEWVYYIFPLEEIDKVKLDGSQKTRVCSIDVLQVYNANVDKYHGPNGSTSITAEYKDGYILYTCFQLKQVDDKKTNPPSYYKLDPNTDKITQVKGK